MQIQWALKERQGDSFIYEKTRSCRNVQRGWKHRRKLDGDVTVVLIEHPYGVDDDGNTEESLDEIEDLECWSERKMAAIMPHFFLPQTQRWLIDWLMEKLFSKVVPVSVSFPFLKIFLFFLFSISHGLMMCCGLICYSFSSYLLTCLVGFFFFKVLMVFMIIMSYYT